MKHFWKTYKKYIIVAFVALLLVVGVPLVMTWIGNQPNEDPVLEMKDYMEYYGSIVGSLIGAIATVLVLVKTIDFTIKNQKDERKLSVRPYLELSKYHITKLEELSNSENAVFVEISKGLIESQVVIPERIARMKKTEEKLRKSKSPNMTETVLSAVSVGSFFKNNYILQVDIYNNGAGNAIDVEYRINERPITGPFCVTTDRRKRLIFVLNDDMLENDESTLSFTLEYSDVVLLARYQQKESINFFRATNGDLMISQFSEDLLTKPVEINKNDEAK